MRTASIIILLFGATMMVGCADQPADQSVEQPPEEPAVELQLPAAVATAFAEANPGVEMVEFEREELADKVVWEIETKVGDMEKDFIYSEDGTLLQTEEDIAIESLPEPVMAAVMAAHPGAEVDEAEMVTAGGMVGYKVTVETAEDQEIELVVSPDGEVLSSEHGEADDDDGDDDEDEGEAKTGDA